MPHVNKPKTERRALKKIIKKNKMHRIIKRFEVKKGHKQQQR